ncbi:MAG TPA: branched-chain amino acid ABC transporter permease [Alphaproteobacteria bacterium]|nr:branched-chain amino acid ABC transporter permease [Alphaproteobacteria bacterium]
MDLLQLVLNGIALGAAYALVALGFVLVLNATGAVNFAQGDLVMAGGFVAVALAQTVPAPGILLLPLVLLGMAMLGLIFSALAYFPLMRRPPVTVFISTIAMGIVLQNAANAIFGAEPRATPALLGDRLYRLGGLVIGEQSLAIIGVAAALVLAQHLLFTRTQLGRSLRATAQDRDMARAIGIPVARMIALTFALASALAGAAGLLLAHQYFVEPTRGTELIVSAYIAVVIGGWGSLPGAVLGALLVALFEVIASAYVSYTAATALLYIALLALLWLRPQGLLGEPFRRRV